MQSDTLGVVFSFLNTQELIEGCLLVCKEWHQVLCELPHAWGHKLHIRLSHDIPHSKFAWHRITELNLDFCWRAFPHCR